VRRTRLSPPSPAGVISAIALFVALGGTGYAASRIVAPPARTAAAKATKKYVKREAKVIADAEIAAKAATLTVGTATNATNSQNAQNSQNAVNAQTAGNANNLGGQPPTAFVSSSKVQRFNVKVGFGQNVTLFTAGVFTFSLKCVQNGTDPAGTPNESYAALEVATSRDGAVFFASANSANGGGGSSTFLNTSTPENSRVWQLESVPAGGSGFAGNFDGGTALGPDGTAVSLSNEGTGLGVNLFGVGCVAEGFAIINS
jgi:hypothetical protein